MSSKSAINVMITTSFQQSTKSATSAKQDVTSAQTGETESSSAISVFKATTFRNRANCANLAKLVALTVKKILVEGKYAKLARQVST